MSALRDTVESGGQSLLSVHKRADALLLGEEDLFFNDDAIQTILAVIVEKLDAIEAFSDEQRRELGEAFATLRDGTARTGILDAAARMRAHSPEAYEAAERTRAQEER